MKIMVVDDHPLFRTAFCKMLSENILIKEIANAANGKEAISRLKKSRFDAIFLDINMPVMNGYDAFCQIREEFPAVKILMLTQHDEKSVILYFVKHGAHAFLTKASDMSEIDGALNALKLNHKYFSPSILEVIKDSVHEIDVFSNKLEMTNYEKRLIEFLGKGFSSKEVATELGMTVNTINTYRERLLIKTGVKNVAELISFAYTHGILM